MKLDFISLLGLCAFMVAQNLGLFGMAGLWLWLVLCAALFLLYPLLQKREVPSLLRCVLLLVRVVVILLISVAFGMLFDYWLRPRDLGELPMAASLFTIPALALGVVAFIIGCVTRTST